MDRECQVKERKFSRVKEPLACPCSHWSRLVTTASAVKQGGVGGQPGVNHHLVPRNDPDSIDDKGHNGRLRRTVGALSGIWSSLR